MNFDYKIEEIEQIAAELNDYCKKYHKFVFYGEMGTGKTTLVKAWCKILGVKSDVNSPTYSLINEYELDDKRKVYHCDLYRLNDLDEALEIGIEEYLNSSVHYLFIEWPQLIEDLLDDDFCKISLSVNEDNSRKIIVN